MTSIKRKEKFDLKQERVLITSTVDALHIFLPVIPEITALEVNPASMYFQKHGVSPTIWFSKNASP